MAGMLESGYGVAGGSSVPGHGSRRRNREAAIRIEECQRKCAMHDVVAARTVPQRACPMSGAHEAQCSMCARQQRGCVQRQVVGSGECRRGKGEACRRSTANPRVSAQ